MEISKGKQQPNAGTILRAVRGGILALALVVFLGNIMMWIIMPTFTYYNKWLPKILLLNSTFFNIQGPIMLDFTLPILFIAVLGCIYLYLGKKSGNPDMGSSKKEEFAALKKTLKKPMIIKCLGIVNWVELTLLAMFIILCVWYFSAFVRFHFSTVAQRAMQRGDQLWQAKLDRVALVVGVTGNICLTFLFYPVARGSSILPLLGLTSEGSIKYHIWIGHMAMTLFTAHGVLYICYWAITHRLSEMLKWDQHYVSNVAGEISLLCGLILWITTYPNIRRKMFELFYYTHHLYILFMVFFIFHTGIFFACIMLPGFYLFLIDRYLRFLQSRQNVALISARVLPCETVELNFSKSRVLEYTPTSTVFVNVPSISKLQWHPFTVCSNSNLEPETLSVVIKCEGSWTKKLYETVSSPSPVDRLQVSLEGPYGPASAHFLRHDTLVMVSGGSGITPFISVIRELIFMSSTMKCKTPKIQLISVFKNSSHLTMLDLLLPVSGAPAGSANVDIQIQAYITRERGQPTEKPEPLRTLWFKPPASDAPMTPCLGKNSTLWLAAIISSSFAIYLLLLGLVTRYYIYPIDHNTNLIYSYTAKAALNMLFICISIVISASAAFLWTKKTNAREAKQIQDMESTTSLNSLLNYADTELESLPHQSIIKSIKVQYGHRPDLKRILLESKGSSVGALVCGPKQMRHEVAAICSSGMADNLHFESISFNW